MFDIDLFSSVSGFDIELSPSSTGRLYVKLSSIFSLYPTFVKIGGSFIEKQVYVKAGGIFV